MKILIVSHTYIVELNSEKLRQLAQNYPNVEVTIVVPKKWRPGGVQNKMIETQPRIEGNFRVIPISNFSQNNQALLTFGLDIISLLKTFKPDIIQVEQGAKSLGYAQLITLNKILGIKAKNIFFTWWNLPYTVKFPLSWLERYNLKNTQAAIAGNQDGVKILKDHGYNGLIEVMPQLGVDETLFYPSTQSELAQELRIEKDEFIIGYIGRFVQEKGILTLIKALAGLLEYPWKLLLLGRGPLQEEIVEKASSAGFAERIILVPSVPHSDVPRYLNLMSTLVLPSETSYQVKTITAVGWKEQFGHVLIEAMACKVPVIGSDSGEIPHVIGEAGLIFPEGDNLALRGCLTQMMTLPPSSLPEKLAQLGYQRSFNEYTNKVLAKKLFDFYQKVLSVQTGSLKDTRQL